MKQVLSVVWDRRAEASVGPIISTTAIGVAIRMFEDVVRDERSAISRHPSDYDLVQVGEFDTVTMELVSLSVPQHIIRGTDLLSPLPELES